MTVGQRSKGKGMSAKGVPLGVGLLLHASPVICITLANPPPNQPDDGSQHLHSTLPASTDALIPYLLLLLCLFLIFPLLLLPPSSLTNSSSSLLFSPGGNILSYRVCFPPLCLYQ